MRFTVTFLAFITIISGLYAQSWQEEMDSVLAILENQEIFDGQVLIAEKGQVLFNQAYGHEEDHGKITRTTSLGVESVSKIITSTAIMMLHDQERLKISDPLFEYFPSLPYPEVTIKDLLSMSSGLPRFLSTVIQNADTTQVISNSGIIKLIEIHKPLGGQPGNGFQYNDTNYLLLVQVIPKLTLS